MRRSNPGATTRAAPATQTVVLRPLDCFASLAMTDRELAHLFLRVALDGEPFHGGLIPRDTCAWPVRDVNRAVADLEWFRQERITPSPPIPASPRFPSRASGGQKIPDKDASTWVAPRAGDRRGSQPARDASDPFQVGHVAIRRARCDRLQEVPGAIDVFASLQRGFQLARKPRRAHEVIEHNGFFEPFQPLIVELMSAGASRH